ncbi:type II toxin-antitoxin system RelE/ParE family toxin [Desulfococcus multivorans]|jgi:toxin ParE1/3/4|uniref:Plasmid stabilization system n=2 Tax=Desulfococcus multivorans TaxID=897 RepID=S7TY63_DESML|nr:type II toxin-antitoxin system RelE/ParE family toxin [Desulfococcus multivorans]MDY0038860.1 type II toxin-antitoxin system RelE/ParE family toxin [Desulforhabdus sp.]AOY57455.1 ParE: DNA topoisomerase 4 subunit B [Desulfococcus multivorans]AQU99889.1 plasmid stabilization protein [Desulfococcus multivorans]EPR42081.1 plasmid stabilization system [Desulfococcus multivorans DSM 2059]CAJ13807.1 plasmid stabilization system protein [Desulfococcus multivorans]
MAFQVYLTDDASRDLEELYDYIESHDAPEKADYVLDQIEKAFSSLSENPERGTYPEELLAVGLREYREIFFKAYRIIYRVMAENVYVMVIADGRRDMQALLQRRLLQA